MQKGLSSNTVGQWLVEKNHPAIEKLFVIDSFEKFVSVSEKKIDRLSKTNNKNMYAEYYLFWMRCRDAYCTRSYSYAVPWLAMSVFPMKATRNAVTTRKSSPMPTSSHRIVPSRACRLILSVEVAISRAQFFFCLSQLQQPSL